MDKQIQLDKTAVGDARYAEVQIVGWKRNGDARVAPGKKGGKAGGKKGGKARMAALTLDERRALARKAVQTRWAKAKKKSKKP